MCFVICALKKNQNLPWDKLFFYAVVTRYIHTSAFFKDIIFLYKAGNIDIKNTNTK